VLRQIERGAAPVEQKQRPPLEDCFSARVGPSFRVVFFIGIDGAFHVFYLGFHDYDEAERRISSRPGVHYHWLPDDDAEAVEHLRSAHGGRHAFVSTSDDPFDTRGVHEVTTREGFTVHDHYGDAPRTGYMVSLSKSGEYSFPLDRLTPEAIGHYRKVHAADLRDPDNYLGAWVYQGRVYLDVSQHVRDRATAVRLGQQRDQLAVYDLAANAAIDTHSVPAQRAAKANGRGERAWGKNDLDALFPDGAASTQVPWTDGRVRGRVDYDEDAVGAAMRGPGGHLAEVDPRELSAIQGGLTRAGVAYYLTDEYSRSGRTFADPDRATNKHPIVYRRRTGQLVILTGHHRAAAALLQGKPLQCLLVEEPASVHAHRHAVSDGGRHAARAVSGHPGHLGQAGREDRHLRRGGGAAARGLAAGAGDAGPVGGAGRRQPGAHREDRLAAVDDWLPDKGMFTPGQPTLDPRIFAGEVMRPDARAVVMGLLDGFWRPQYGDWTAWAKVYLAGSGASHWWDSDGDLDILIGISLPALVAARPQNAGVSEAEVCAHLNHGLKADLDPATAAYDLGPPKPMEVTFFCNPGSYDIRAIHPYAAYDISADRWVVRPPDLPADWSARSAPQWVAAHARQVAAMARHVLALPEPERTLQGTALFNRLHEWRQQAYAEGGGWLAFGNVVYQFLQQTPDHLLSRLYLLKHPAVGNLRDEDLQGVRRAEASGAVPHRGQGGGHVLPQHLSALPVQGEPGVSGSQAVGATQDVQGLFGGAASDRVQVGADVSGVRADGPARVQPQALRPEGVQGQAPQVEVRHHDRAVRGDGGGPGGSLRDVRAQAHQEQAAARRSLPQDGRGAGAAVHPVQPADRSRGGRPGGGSATGAVDGALPRGLSQHAAGLLAMAGRDGSGYFDMSGEVPRWVQPHDELLADALWSWKGWPSTMRLHMQDIGGSIPGSGSGKQMRAQAEALAEELRRAKPSPRALYRGDHRQPEGLTAWSELRSVAQTWAKKGGGKVWVLPRGTRGLRVEDYISSQANVIEREWLVPDPSGAVEWRPKTGSAAYGPDLIARGLTLREYDEAFAKRVLAGTATVADFVRVLDPLGVWWGVMGDYGDLADFEDHAFGAGDPSITLKGMTEDGYVGADFIAGEIEVVLVAKRPTRNGEPWDPEKHNPSNGLMGNSNLESGEPVEVVEVRYDAGWGWHSLKAPGGIRATAHYSSLGMLASLDGVTASTETGDTSRYKVLGWRRNGFKPRNPDLYRYEDKPAGPWHALVQAGSQPQSWCGSKMKGINQDGIPEGQSPPEGDATCATCVRAIAQGKPKSYRRRM
jgi:hypothetical protein